MKTKNAVLTLAAVIVASAFTFAAEPTSKVAVLNQKNSGIFKVIYEGTKAGMVTLKVYDSKNNLLVNEVTRGLSKFMIPLNFSDLEEGEYKIEITDAQGTQFQNVNYKIAQKPSFQKLETENEASVNAYHVTKLQEEGKYLMSVASKGNGKINVQIFDGSDNLIHSESLTLTGNIGLVYNLKNVEGKPVFRVTNSK